MNVYKSQNDLDCKLSGQWLQNGEFDIEYGEWLIEDGGILKKK